MELVGQFYEETSRINLRCLAVSSWLHLLSATLFPSDRRLQGGSLPDAARKDLKSLGLQFWAGQKK